MSFLLICMSSIIPYDQGTHSYGKVYLIHCPVNVELSQDTDEGGMASRCVHSFLSKISSQACTLHPPVLPPIDSARLPCGYGNSYFEEANDESNMSDTPIQDNPCGRAIKLHILDPHLNVFLFAVTPRSFHPGNTLEMAICISRSPRNV